MFGDDNVLILTIELTEKSPKVVRDGYLTRGFDA